MLDETDLHNSVALDLLEKRKITGSYKLGMLCGEGGNSQLNRQSATRLGGQWQRR
jgi:hypothetical protein